MSGGAFTRRSFLKFLATLATIYGVEGIDFRQLEQAFGSKAFKLPAAWISGLGCGGCSESFFSIENPDLSELLLNLMDLNHYEVPAGHEDLKKLLKEEMRLLIVEGSIPAEGTNCLMEVEEFTEALREISKKLEFIIALGSCSSFGGIPSLGFSKTVSLRDFTGRKDVINLTTCPANPGHLAVLLTYLIYFGRPPELDSSGRPKMFFSARVHDTCERRNHFEEGRFLTDLNDHEQRDFCLYRLGCKGMHASADCAVRRWNGINSWCVSCNAGCQACSERDFFVRMAPFFENRTALSTGKELVRSSAIFAAGAAASLVFKSICSAVSKRKGEKNLDKTESEWRV